MIPAIILFAATYVLMLTFGKYRPYIALASGLIFAVTGMLPLGQIIPALDFNVLLMIGGTMGLVQLFIDSHMPERMADMIMNKVPNVQWAAVALSLFAGVISAFVDNVATVLMVAPVAIEICKKLKTNPVPFIIAIAVSSNLQGAATLVGDTTSMLLGGFAGMNFLDFFWMQGKPGIFWGVELGALIACLVVLWLFRGEKAPIQVEVETKVDNFVPTWMLVGTVGLLIVASFIPAPASGTLLTLYNMRSGLICVAMCLIGIVYTCAREKSGDIVRRVLADLDRDTLLLLFGLFMVIEGIKAAGVIDAIADLFYRFAGDSPFLLYTLIVFVSVILSAFIDNIPYVATMLPVVESIAALMGLSPLVFYFGLLTGATLGGNLTPIGASANITAIGILRKHGETVKTRDFLRIGVPFTLAAVLAGYVFIWLVWGV